MGKGNWLVIGEFTVYTFNRFVVAMSSRWCAVESEMVQNYEGVIIEHTWRPVVGYPIQSGNLGPLVVIDIPPVF